MRLRRLAIALTLVGCGGAADAPQDAEEPAPFGEPVEIAWLPGVDVEELVTDEERLFWSETGSTHVVKRWEASGGEPVVIGTVNGDSGPLELVVVGDEVVYSSGDQDGCTVGALAIDGGGARVLEAPPLQRSGCSGLSTDGSAIAWGRYVDFTTGHVRRAETSTAVPAELWTGDGNGVWDTAVYGDETFWSADAKIWRGDGATAAVALSLESDANVIAVNGDRLYWGERWFDELSSVPLDALGAVPTEYGNAGLDLERLAVDDAYVYVTTGGGIFRVFPRDGGADWVLSEPSVEAFAVGHGGVYQALERQDGTKIVFTPRNE